MSKSICEESKGIINAINILLKAHGTKAKVASNNQYGCCHYSLELFDTTPAIVEAIKPMVDAFNKSNVKGTHRGSVQQIVLIKTYTTVFLQKFWDYLRANDKNFSGYPAVFIDTTNAKFENGKSVYMAVLNMLYLEENNRFWAQHKNGSLPAVLLAA